jgi:hypothetical protein
MMRTAATQSSCQKFVVNGLLVVRVLGFLTATKTLDWVISVIFGDGGKGGKDGGGGDDGLQSLDVGDFPPNTKVSTYSFHQHLTHYMEG